MLPSAHKVQRQQAKADRMREKEQEKEARKTQREQDRELKIKQRRKEQERRKEQKKQERVCAREQHRIVQSNSSWWKEFDWAVGVMVEMEYEGEWWDAIVIKLVDVPDRKQNEDEKPASQNPGAHSAAVIAAGAGSETEANRDADVENHSSGDVAKGAVRSAETGEGASGSRDQVDNSALLPDIQLAICQGPAIRYPDDWPEDGVYICAEDDRPLDVARLHRVNLTRLVAQNKKSYPGLSNTSPLKAGTELDLPLPLDIAIEDEPAPPPDPLKVGVVLIHYVGGSEEETEWVYTCSKRIRPSADKTWNAVAVEAAAKTPVRRRRGGKKRKFLAALDSVVSFESDSELGDNGGRTESESEDPAPATDGKVRSADSENKQDDDDASEYEQLRAANMKRNALVMQQLGLTLDLPVISKMR